MPALDLLLFALGLTLLALGAEGLVRGGARLAAALNVSPLLIGLTIVAFGTSMPEFVVSVLAAVQGRGGLAIGNVVGSNLFNLLAVLGPAAMIAPLAVRGSLVRRELPLMIVSALLIVLLAIDGTYGRLEGAFLLTLLLGFVVYSYRVGLAQRREALTQYAAEFPPTREPRRRLVRHAAFVLVGLALLTIGGRVALTSAVSLAEAFGISERVIALTLVSAGTGLPELATVLVAALRRHADIAVGNLIGSNIFNTLGILGAAALAAPMEVPPAMLRFDLPIMAVVTLVMFPVLVTAKRVSRWEGALLLTAYASYLGFVLWIA